MSERERVLLLAPHSALTELLKSILERFGIDEITWIQSPDKLVGAPDPLGNAQVILVAHTFCRTTLDTATLIRRIRPLSASPIIGFGEFATAKGLFAFSVAGCNFTVEGRNDHEGMLHELVMLLGNVLSELKRDYFADVA